MPCHVLAYGCEVDVPDIIENDEGGDTELTTAEGLALACAGFEASPPSLLVLTARKIQRDLDRFDFSHYLAPEVVSVLERVDAFDRRVGENKSATSAALATRRDLTRGASLGKSRPLSSARSCVEE